MLLAVRLPPPLLLRLYLPPWQWLLLLLLLLLCLCLCHRLLRNTGRSRAVGLGVKRMQVAPPLAQLRGRRAEGQESGACRAPRRAAFMHWLLSVLRRCT